MFSGELQNQVRIVFVMMVDMLENEKHTKKCKPLFLFSLLQTISIKYNNEVEDMTDPLGMSGI